MKFKIIILFSFLNWADFTFAQEYFLNLPGEQLQASLTSKNFPNMDAIIIVKEQSFMVENGTTFYQGVELEGLNETISNAIIVKLFNEKAVNKYGTFTYEYFDRFGNELKNQFTARARVLKPNGDIEEVDEDDIVITDKIETSYSSSKIRRVSFKIPNLAVDDIVQIEYTYTNLFSDSPSEMFYFNDDYYILYSNLYITLPASNEYKYVSFPADKIGTPRVEQVRKSFGAGKTYIWSVKNLYPMPDEYNSATYDDKAFVTGFYSTERDYSLKDDWKDISEKYFNKFIDKGRISESDIELLGIVENTTSVDMEKVKELYTRINKYFQLSSYNFIRPDVKDIDDKFEMKSANASDLAYIFYKILRKWELKPEVVFIRDKRDGVFRPAIPTLKWFDRIAINVKINGEEKLFDFDRSLSSKWEQPWYLNEVTLPFFNEDSIDHRKISYSIPMSQNLLAEKHHLTLSENVLNDSLNVLYKGSYAQKMRYQLYDKNESEIKELLTNDISHNNISSINSSSWNSFKDESDVLLNCSGKSKCGYELIDNYLSITPKNYFLTDLRDKFTTGLRYSDINFDTPFEINYDLSIPLTEEFTLTDIPDIVKTGPSNSVFSISRKIENTSLVIKAYLKFPQTFIPANRYNELMGFINSAVQELEKSIVLKK